MIRTRVYGLLLTGVLTILVWNLLGFEDRGLYHPEIAAFKDPMEAIAALPIRSRIQEVYFKTSDGIRLNAWYVKAQPDKPTIVFAHGNGGNLAERWEVIKAFSDKGYGFLAFDYRGYGKSEGRPSEQGLYCDLEAASRYLVAKGIPFRQQIALGESLGSGVVVEVATRLPYRAVVLYASLTSTPAVAAYLRTQNRLGWLGWLPLELLMQQRFDSLAKIERIKSPLLVIHGEQDEMMPLTMPRSLLAKATTPHKRLLLIPKAGHNTVFTTGQTQLLAALSAMLETSD